MARVLAVLALVFVLLSGAASSAQAQPLRVNVECEETGRTKACPAFLLGFIDAHKVFLQSPRAAADVILYVHATEIALVDRVHLRFVSNMPNTPHLIEIDVELDSRADDDTQRGQLEPAFLRGMALYVASRFPEIVNVALGEPDGEEATAKNTSPWDFGLELGAWGNWSGKYQSYNTWESFNVGRVQRRKRLGLNLWGGNGKNKQPPLVLEDGTEISTDTSNYHFGGQLEGAYLYNHCYSIGASTSAWRDDPKGQFRYGWDGKVGVEWDRYRADDPRGNRLSVAYILAYTVEGYNLRNEIGEIWAHYPKHKLVATGQFRKDKVNFGLQLEVGGEVFHPGRRHAVSASPSIEVKLGDHIDFSISFSITKRELPAPDVDLIDPTDYAQLTRLSFAEPLSMNGSFNVRFHWDRTNGQRNDRLDML
jgi:hypothetical protein